MQFGVSEVARLLKVDRDVVKTWAYHFSEYLTPQANPAKGVARVFSKDDLRVLSYIFMYWEDEPDYENIRYGLNSNSHFEEPYDTFVRENTPMFQEPPDDLDETWRHGAIYGGMVSGADSFELAESYKRAGDIVVAAALESDDVYSLFCPVVYNYRHATELYLKAITDERTKTHDLKGLLAKFREQMKSEFNEIPPKWFEDIVLSFNEFDPGSTTFRYGEYVDWDEVWIDLPHLKGRMDMFADVMTRIRFAQFHA